MEGNIEVVISGIGGWFPESKTLEELGVHLLNNENLVRKHDEKWITDANFPEKPSVGSIGDYGHFDHSFFGLHQKLAFWTDPILRLSLERSFEAVIDAGLSPRELRGSKTNVYCSSTFNDLEALMLDHFSAPGGYAIAGMSKTMISNRISYFYDLKGQSCGFDGNWAWGQLGLQLAVRSIRDRECDAALVLGSSVVQRPHRHEPCRALGLISQDGLCRSFDAAAEGGQRSEAVVCFLVQHADRAKRSYGQVLGSLCQAVGPIEDPALHSAEGIEALLRTLYRECGQDPTKVAYLEADGSGCKRWEEAELLASQAVLGRGRTTRSPLLVGSVKSNLGHTDGCAGMVSIAKLVLAAEKGRIPANLHYTAPNPNVPALVDGRIKVVTSNTPLAVREDTLLATTTLGLGGTVGHVLLKPNASTKRPPLQPLRQLPRIATVSGRTEDGVLRSLREIGAKPYDPEYLRLVQDAFTDIRGHTVRGFTIVPPLNPTSAVELVNSTAVELRPLVFVFSGMGSQWPGMATPLMDIPIFAQSIQRLHDVLATRGVDLKAILTNESPDAFDNILHAIVGIAAMQIALTNVLRALRLFPDLLIGHSLGEMACGYADGCLSEEQAILSSYVRGKATSEARLVPGMMAAIGVSYRDIQGRLPPEIDVACHNSATGCTLSGPVAEVERFVEQLASEGMFARTVNASGIAFHSRYVRPAAEAALRDLRVVIPTPRPRSARWLSTSVPEGVETEAARLCSAEYQTNNLVSPVLFEEALLHVPEDAVVLEVAPHGLLQAILKRALPANPHVSLAQRCTPGAGPHGTLEAIGRLYTLGLNPLVSAIYPEVSFPVSRGTPSLASLVSWNHSERNTFIDSNSSGANTTYTCTVTADSPFVDFAGRSCRPVSQMLMDVLEGWHTTRRARGTSKAVTFRNVHILQLVENPSAGELKLSVSFLLASGCFEMTDDSGALVMQGSVAEQTEAPPNLSSPSASASPGCSTAITMSGSAAYEQLRATGLEYGAALRVIHSLQQIGDEWLVSLRAGTATGCLLESMLQVVLLAAADDAHPSALRPTAIQRIDFRYSYQSPLHTRDMPLLFSRRTGLVDAGDIRMEGVQIRHLDSPQAAVECLDFSCHKSANKAPRNIIAVGKIRRHRRGSVQNEFNFVESGGSERRMGVARCGAGSARTELDAVLAWPVPRDWSDQQAAAVPIAYCTAMYALGELARARAGESVLVHEGLSPEGQAAIRVALRAGCTPIYTTVHSEQQRRQLIAAFPQVHPGDVMLLDSFEWSLRMRGLGVQVGVGGVFGEPLHASLRCMARGGRYVHCAPLDTRLSSMGTRKFLDSVTVFGLASEHLLTASPERRRCLADAMTAGLADRTVQPVVVALERGDRGARGASCSGAVEVAAPLLPCIARSCKPDHSYLIIGDASSPTEWLEVARSLALHGARSVLAVVSGAPARDTQTEFLVRHRLAALRRRFGLHVILREAADPTVTATALREVLQEAQGSEVGQLDGVVILARDADTPDAVLTALLDDHDVGVDVAKLVCVSDPGLFAELGGNKTTSASSISPCGGVSLLCAPVYRMLGALPRWLAGSPLQLQEVSAAAAQHDDGQAISDRSLTFPMEEVMKSLRVAGERPVRLRAMPTLAAPLQRRQGRPGREVFPLVVIPPLGLPPGPSHRAQLAALGSRCMLPALLAEVPPHGLSLPDQARGLVRELKAMAHGPYNLLSWGLGTPLALETARQLEKENEHQHSCCVFLLGADVFGFQDWAKELSVSETELQKLAEQHARQLRVAVDVAVSAARRCLGALARHRVPASTPRTGRIVVLRASSKQAVTLSDMDNVEILTVRPLRLDSEQVCNVVNSRSAWSRGYKTPSNMKHRYEANVDENGDVLLLENETS